MLSYIHKEYQKPKWHSATTGFIPLFIDLLQILSYSENK